MFNFWRLNSRPLNCWNLNDWTLTYCILKIEYSITESSKEFCGTRRRLPTATSFRSAGRRASSSSPLALRSGGGLAGIQGIKPLKSEPPPNTNRLFRSVGKSYFSKFFNSALNWFNCLSKESIFVFRHFWTFVGKFRCPCPPQGHPDNVAPAIYGGLQTGYFLILRISIFITARFHDPWESMAWVSSFCKHVENKSANPTTPTPGWDTRGGGCSKGSAKLACAFPTLFVFFLNWTNVWQFSPSQFDTSLQFFS